jgi:NAD(P)-dependent dehydrogenase (short-subunit alcohol dehydrogenase family)
VSDLAGQRGFVTGGGRGIGESVARELAAAGMEVAVSGRTAEQVESVAAAIGGRALVGDVTRREDVERWFGEAGPVDFLVANAGTGNAGGPPWEVDLDDWWRTFEVNVLGVHLCCSAVIPQMLERSSGRIVIVGSGSAYLPGTSETAYSSSKAAVCRYGETLANALRDPDPGVRDQPRPREDRDDGRLPGRCTVDTAGVCAAARAGTRVG